MAKKKKIKAQIKLQIPAAAANPAPPVGPALGQHGVNIMEFCKQFNEATKGEETGMLIPVVISVYEDRSFAFITRVPPISSLIKKAVGIAKASGVPNKEKKGKLSMAQVREIAAKKLPDLNTENMDSACRMVEGTARSMGIEVGD
ncbi:MAG: 50S ribosomal protein L11 [Candidatus Omnitrophota bacterium]|nr:50S ribosomal protein L11 [Candidatus Omnitrophota bacterium]MBU2528323.1 50S ribosomal protein L11 [bacterium]MBU3930032.1 50S ribosomal protein L11 [bacterium]MBU4123373.1 50S ribosomal protein L11 [bacterium]